MLLFTLGLYHVAIVTYHVAIVMYHFAIVMYHFAIVMYHVAIVVYHVAINGPHFLYLSWAPPYLSAALTKVPVIFQSYLLQVMYVTFQYLTVSCIPTIGRVYDISVSDSFMYTYHRLCIWHLNIVMYHVAILY